ncbi:MAG: hypothetical protein WC356_02055 [Candidatus Micrarchaeia archaeon]
MWIAKDEACQKPEQVKKMHRKTCGLIGQDINNCECNKPTQKPDGKTEIKCGCGGKIEIVWGSVTEHYNKGITIRAERECVFVCKKCNVAVQTKIDELCQGEPEAIAAFRLATNQDKLDAQAKEIEELKVELKDVKHILFEYIIAPNCSTCSNQMSNLCDNGILCMGKLMKAEFIRYDQHRLYRQITTLKAENETLKDKIKRLQTGYLNTGKEI